MNLTKIYSFSDGNQLWRLLPDEKDKIIIETRDTESKEVFFNCLKIRTGEEVFTKLQFEEKFWIGVEAVHQNLIIFHKFAKPDMPGHREVIVYDIEQGKIIWQTDEYSFLFSTESKIYCFKQKFEGRDFLALDIRTGEVVEDLGNNYEEINRLRYEAENSKDYSSYQFPELLKEDENDLNLKQNIFKIVDGKETTGSVEYVKYNDHLLFNYHEKLNEGEFRNVFKLIDLDNNSEVESFVLNKNVNAYAPDSFFVKDNLLFTLKEKTRLDVYKLEN